MNNFKFFNENVLVSSDGLVSRLKGNYKGVSTGCKSKGYMQKRIDGKLWFVHDLVWTTFRGEIPDGYVVHHINGQKDDNRLENLELMPRSEHSRMHMATQPEKAKQKRIKTLVENVKSDEVKQKISETMKKVKKTDEWIKNAALAHSKPVRQIPLDGSPEKVWVSATEAARQLKCIQSNIQKCCVGKLKKHHNSKWEYV